MSRNCARHTPQTPGPALAAAFLSLAVASLQPLSAEVLTGRPAGPYTLTLELAPTPVADEPTTVTTRLVRTRTGEPVTGLQVLHERVVHNFIVARDFSSFVHIHHEDFAALTEQDLAAATFQFPYTFPKAGGYRMVSEFTHRDRSWSKHFDIEVSGSPAAKPVVDLTREKTVSGITGTLSTSPAQPVAGFETELVLTLKRDDMPVEDLALILGSEVHMALWRLDGELFGHAHSYTPHMAMMMAGMGELSPAQRASRMADMMVAMIDMPAELVFQGPTIPLRYVFPEPGTYAVFLQCAPGDEATVFDFMVEAVAYAEGMDTTIQSIVSQHGAH